jgi:hypothetical protein
MKAEVERRKLHLIEEFLNISNETIIAKIESLLREERLKFLEKQLKMMPKKERLYQVRT